MATVYLYLLLTLINRAATTLSNRIINYLAALSVYTPLIKTISLRGATPTAGFE